MKGKGPLKAPRRGRSKNALASAASNDLSAVEPRDPVEIANTVLAACNRKRNAATYESEALVTDDALSKMARFTDKFKLKPYERFLHYVPRLVNVVTVCAALTAEAWVPLNGLNFVSLCARSLRKPSPFLGAGPLCRSISTGSPPAAATPTMHPRSSARCSWPTRSRGAAYLSSVRHCHQIEPVYLLK